MNKTHVLIRGATTMSDKVWDAEQFAAPPIQIALAEVMRNVGPIAKDLRNTQSHYAARSIDDVMDALHDIMAAEGVLPIPTVEDAQYQDRGKQHQAILRVRWTFYGPAGDSISGVTYGEALDSSDKATNKALQASLKYLLLDSFLIPVNGDQNDADSTSPQREERSAPRTTRDAATDAQLKVLADELEQYADDAFTAWVAEFDKPLRSQDVDDILHALKPYKKSRAGSGRAPDAAGEGADIRPSAPEIASGAEGAATETEPVVREGPSPSDIDKMSPPALMKLAGKLGVKLDGTTAEWRARLKRETEEVI